MTPEDRPLERLVDKRLLLITPPFFPPGPQAVLSFPLGVKRGDPWKDYGGGLGAEVISPLSGSLWSGVLFHPPCKQGYGLLLT